MFATLAGIAGAVVLTIVFLVLRLTMRPKRELAPATPARETADDNTQAKKRLAVPAIRGMDRLRTEDCANAVETGGATKDMQNRFRMDYWTMPMPLRQLSAFSTRSVSEGPNNV
mmetsp:Transcript_66351/g.147440  ORF Transcript_66351/g.147440 Transcript_66351/m.147440 type:complete len:114 (-) Transcript_66351:123-464(-)